jgi:hypothetical protein
MSIADPMPAGGKPLVHSEAELSAIWNKWRAENPAPALNREIHLRVEEYDRNRIKAEKHRQWKSAVSEAARIKKHGPRPPFPRLADTWDGDGDEYWAAPTDHHHFRESAIIDGLNVKRESDYVEHCMNTAGFIMPDAPYKKSLRRRFVRYDQSVRLAMILVNGGARKPECRRNAPSILTLVSRQEIKLPIIPRVNFLPETAASRRSPMLKEVETHLERNRYARMATFSIGKRTPLNRVRETHKRLTRKLSKLNAELWFKAVAAIVFRAVEYGTPKLCVLTADITLHVHAHTIFQPHRFVAPKKWRKFCKRVSRYIGAHWDAGRPVDNPRELVKYPVKPADLEKMHELGGDAAVCEFYRQTIGLRMVETLGSLRVQRSSMKNTKRRRVKERNADGWIPATRRSWNSRGRSVTKAAIRAKRKQTATTAEFRAGMEQMQGFCHLPEPTPAAPKMLNRIVARLAPAPFASRVYEPAAFVWNFDGNWDAITSHRCVARVIAAVRPQVEESLKRVARERQRATGPHNSSHQSRNCPDGENEIGLLNSPPDPFRRHLEAIST